MDMLNAFRAWLGKRDEDEPLLPEDAPRIEYESSRVTPLGERSMPYSALEAFALVDPLARQYDPGARLALITAGDQVREDGRSLYWFFSYDFPLQRAQGYSEVRTTENFDPDAEMHEYELMEVVWPFPRHGSYMGERFVREQWSKELERRPPLPVPFRDSTEAMPDLIEASGGELANVGNPNLRTEHDTRGVPVWRSGTRDREFDTPLTPQGA